jgi:hypothetical protein
MKLSEYISSPTIKEHLNNFLTNQILSEASGRETAMQMLQGTINLYKQHSARSIKDIEAKLTEWFHVVMHKENIIYIAAWAKQVMLNELIEDMTVDPDEKISDNDKEKYERIKNKAARLQRKSLNALAKKIYPDQLKYTEDSDGLSFGHIIFSEMQHFSDIDEFINEIRHYKNIDSVKIQEYLRPFTRDPKRPSGIIRDLEVLEEEWKESMSRFVKPNPRNTVLIDFNDGFKWMNLNIWGCQEEADGGSHCGNLAMGSETDTILSLRETKKHPETKEDMEIIHATFILEEDAYLGERKGWGNHRIKEEYYPYVLELLKLPFIKGLKEGRYATDADFQLEWLDYDDLVSFIDERPDFLTKGLVKRRPELLFRSKHTFEEAINAITDPDDMIQMIYAVEENVDEKYYADFVSDKTTIPVTEEEYIKSLLDRPTFIEDKDKGDTRQWGHGRYQILKIFWNTNNDAAVHAVYRVFRQDLSGDTSAEIKKAVMDRVSGEYLVDHMLEDDEYGYNNTPVSRLPQYEEKIAKSTPRAAYIYARQAMDGTWEGEWAGEAIKTIYGTPNTNDYDLLNATRYLMLNPDIDDMNAVFGVSLKKKFMERPLTVIENTDTFPKIKYARTSEWGEFILIIERFSDRWPEKERDALVSILSTTIFDISQEMLKELSSKESYDRWKQIFSSGEGKKYDFDEHLIKGIYEGEVKHAYYSFYYNGTTEPLVGVGDMTRWINNNVSDEKAVARHHIIMRNMQQRYANSIYDKDAYGEHGLSSGTTGILRTLTAIWNDREKNSFDIESKFTYIKKITLSIMKANPQISSYADIPEILKKNLKWVRDILLKNDSKDGIFLYKLLKTFNDSEIISYAKKDPKLSYNLIKTEAFLNEDTLNTILPLEIHKLAASQGRYVDRMGSTAMLPDSKTLYDIWVPSEWNTFINADTDDPNKILAQFGSWFTKRDRQVDLTAYGHTIEEVFEKFITNGEEAKSYLLNTGRFGQENQRLMDVGTKHIASLLTDKDISDNYFAMSSQSRKTFINVLPEERKYNVFKELLDDSFFSGYRAPGGSVLASISTMASPNPSAAFTRYIMSAIKEKEMEEVIRALTLIQDSRGTSTYYFDRRIPEIEDALIKSGANYALRNLKAIVKLSHLPAIESYTILMDYYSELPLGSDFDVIHAFNHIFSAIIQAGKVGNANIIDHFVGQLNKLINSDPATIELLVNVARQAKEATAQLEANSSEG